MGPRLKLVASLPVLAICFLQAPSASAVVSQTEGNITFQCPDGYEIKGPDCYLLVDVAMTYESAEDTCKIYGARLVEIRDEVEAKDVGQMVQTNNPLWDWYWIGNVQNSAQGACSGYWKQGEPKDVSVSSPIYVAANPHGRWMGRPKMTRLPFVCRTDACVDGTFRCRDGKKCLSNRWTCDGIYDCDDQSDESDCASRGTHYIYQSTGTLDENSGYTAGETRTWVIQGAPGQPLSITFSSINVEEDVDYLEVWSGSPSILTSTLLARLTGTLTNKKVYGYNNFLIVRLVADVTTQKTGFIASWQPDDELSPRNRQITATETWLALTSPDYSSTPSPTVYTRQYTISTDEGSLITLKVMENGLDEGFEYDPETLSNVNGKNVFPEFYVSRSNTFTIYLVSNGCSGPEKFRAKITKGCAVDFTRANGFILPPNFNNQNYYPPSIMCNYIIHAPDTAQRTFQFSFTELRLADGSDSVKVFNGSDMTAPELDPAGDAVFSSTVSDVFVQFVSSLVQTEGFFNLTFNLACPAISNTDNMAVSSMDTQYGTNVTLSCNTGFAFAQEEYENEISVTITCDLGGKWNVRRMPTCAEIYCGVPEAILNGFITSGSGTAKYGASVIYQCYAGFSLSNSNTSTCGDGSTWSQSPTCAASQCIAVPQLAGGNYITVTGSGTDFGTVIRYDCDPGFDLIGSRFILCKTDTTWSHEAPVCQRIKCPMPEVDNGRVTDASGFVEFEGQLTVECDKGFVILGDITLTSKAYTCLSSGQFGFERDVCVDKDECAGTDPCTGQNEECKNTIGNYTCECRDKYTRVGDQCQVINRCTTQTSGCDLENGNCTATNNEEDYVCTCKTGYVLFTQNGTSGRYIPFSEDGQTPGDVYYLNHTCVPRTCGPPPNVTNGRALTSRTTFDFDDSVEYRCDFGYKLKAGLPSKLSCTESDWGTNTPICEPVTCEALVATGLVLNIYPNSTTNPGEKVVLECNSESTNTAYNKTLFCAFDAKTDTFELQGDKPYCPVVDCGDVGNIGGANFSPPNSTRLNASFIFSCTPGFTKEGSSTNGIDVVTCEKNGRWGLGSLTCIGTRCTDPGTPGGMNQTEANFEVGGMVVYTCQRDGFRPNPLNRTCLYNASSDSAYWDSTSPICEDVVKPVFTNCPGSPVRVKLYGSLSSVIATPNATDNSDLVKLTVTPEWLTPEVGFDLGSQPVTYTATDAAGNSASCNFTVETYDPSTLPSLSCPDYLTLKVNTTSPYVVSLDTHVTGDSESTLDYSPGSDVVVGPETVGRSVYRVTATNTFGFHRQCAFIVHIEASSCLSTFITTGISSKNATVSCDTDIGNMQCTVTCNSGFAYQDGSTSMTYNCQGENEWTPALPARYCSGTGDAQYIFEVEVEYAFTNFLITNCENTLSETLKTHIPQQNITFCPVKNGSSQAMKFNVVSVDFNTVTIQTMKARIILAVTTDPEDVGQFRYSICKFELQSNISDALFNVFPDPISCLDNTGNLTPGDRTVIKDGNSCLSGYVLTTISGTEKCVQCEPGSYFNGTHCAECADGKYQDQPGQLECKDCENGASHSTKPRLSSDQCVASCPHGFSNNQTFSPMPAKCLACPMDSYLDTTYTALCTPCNNGTTTFGVEGATSQGQCKAQCPAGQYPVNNTACAVCPLGYYKSNVDNVACAACSMSETTSATQTTTSNDCDPVSNMITCEKGGIPTVDFHRNFCVCPDGYSGSSCEVAVNACDSTPCYNGGSCTSTSPTDFMCSCQFQQTCSMVQNDVQYDSDDTILHQASVADLNDCMQLCLENFTDCAVIILSTLNNGNKFCLLYAATEYTNGTKDADTETYLKTCSQQYLFEGTQCEVDVRDNCTNLTCEDRSFCRDLIDRADCVCPSDSKYMLPSCAIDLDVCDPNPCKNDAECKDSGNGVRATCICPAGFDGDQCDNNIDECEENPDGCLYGGQCQDGINEYSCICSLYSGDHCENMPNFCSTQNACDNGICYNDYNVSSAVCVCESPYQPGSGDQCEEINICNVDNPCINNGTCNRVTVGKTSCQCQEGYTGSRCQHNINDCSSNPCANGTCIDLVNGFRCQCDPGYDGDTCANNINDCQSDNCIPANTERYEDLVQDCKCICKVGYTGMNCETPISECQSFPCQHNGTCSESATPGQYNCTCVDGWTGSNCENLTDFCTPDPCKNNGVCYSLQDNSFCSCESGTFGETCQEASELCDILHPCADVSPCEKSGGTAVCECPQNYTGGSCNRIEDICIDTPCANGGTCVTHAIGYTCKCADGYSGENCTTKADPCPTANCPGESSCVVEDDEVICLCGANQLKSGSSCKDMSSNFDIYFTRPDDPIRSYQPFYLKESSFTIMFWIAPLLEDSPEAPVQLRLSNGTTVLAVDKGSVTFGDKPSVLMKDNVGNKTFTLKKWNQVTVIWAKNGSYDIIFSGINLYGGTTDAAFPPSNEPIFIYIGAKFSGYVSQLLVWQSTLTYNDILSMYSNSTVPKEVDKLVARWTGYRLFNNLWARIVSPSIVMADIAVCDDGRSGNACNGSSPDKESPVLPFCPYNGTFDDTERLVQIGSSLASAFFDPQTISNLDSTLLTFGAYRVVFMEKDEQDNVGFCRFSAYVRRLGQSCDNTEGLNANNLISCDGKGRKVQCPDGGRAPLSPNILTCGLLGSYNLDVPAQLPPAVVCGSNGTKHFTVEVTAKYTLGISCTSAGESPVDEALKQKVKDLHSNWNALCDDNNCNNADVTAKCDGANTKNIKATITIESVPATLTSNGVTLTAKELLQTAMLELGSFNINNVFAAQLQKDTVVILAEPSCAVGFGLHDDECVECTKGSFLNETTKMCELCPFGSITNSDRQMSCSQCPAGRTTLQLGADHCNASCPSGQFLNANDQCQECAKNFYQNATGQVKCLPCPAGTITEMTGSTSTDLCYDTCNAGTELKNSTCVPCARGFYRDGVNQDQEKCEPCPVGNTTRGEGSTSITHCYQTACSEGHFRNSTTNECEECDYGFFQPKKWQDKCEECNASYTTVNKISTRADQCKFKCPAGQENLSGTSCTDCKKGYYRTDSLAHRFINCSACNSSFTTSGEGSQLASDCNIRVCNAGYYRNTTDNQCYECPIGKYQPDSLQEMCLNCSGNTTTKQMGSENKTQCVFFCAAGYEVLSAENQTCKACERGYHKTNDGDNKFNKCKKCDGSNTTDYEASVSAMACDIPICQAGQYISNSSSTCEDCPEDQYQPQIVPNRDTECQPCPTGTGTREAGRSSESACYPVCGDGQQYNSSSSQCEPCPLGTWNSGNSSQRFDQCASCQTGYVTVDEMTGATSIDNCTLRNCPTGSFIDGEDDSNCTLCSVGFYQDLPRQKECNACRTDTNTSGEGSKAESDCTVSCPAGTSQVSITNETCVLCEADSVKPSSGPGTCVPCTGNYTSNDERTQCDVLYCDSGYRYDSGGNTCKPCEVGKYKVNRGKDEVCQPCPKNTTTAEQASTSPSDCSEANCDEGLYSPNGMLPCLACPVGRFKNSTGNQDCTPCTGAFTTEGMGSTSATDCTVVVCPVGQFRQNNQCVNCTIGSFQNETGQTDCYTCPTGYTTTVTGSTSSDDCKIVCSAGKYRDDITNTCMDCPKGQYQENTGETSCNSCTTDYTTANVASNSSSDCFIVCPVGEYSISRTTCEVCPHGKYQSFNGSSSCDNCTDGNTTLQTKSTSTADCQPICNKGHYLNVTSKSCVACALGSYNPYDGNMTTAFTSCQNCTDGFSTSATGSVYESQCAIEDCLPGNFRSEGGCEECPLGKYQPQKSQLSCEDCPSDQTTLLKGRHSNDDCVQTCTDGHEFLFDTKTCQPCKVGYYSKVSESLCSKCERGYTTLNIGESNCIPEVGDTPPRPPQRITIFFTIRIRIGVCTNKDHLFGVIPEIVINIFIRQDFIFPSLCVNRCTNIQITFNGGCLDGHNRGKRATASEQLVDIELADVNDEITDTNGKTYRTEAVVANFFYDLQPEENLLSLNQLEFLGIENITSTAQCQPGQFNDGSGCEYCGAGNYSDDGVRCSQCEMNFYQNSTGQSSCLPCPPKTFTSSTGSTDMSNCTKKCDESGARTTYCSGHGACLFSATATDGVLCECDDSYSGDTCEARKSAADDKTKMIAGIAGGAGAFLLLVLLVIGVVTCLKRASQNGKKQGAGIPREYMNNGYTDDGTSEQYFDYNYPMYDNGMRAMAGRPAVMYINPAVDQEVRDFYSRDRSTAPPSRARSRSYESEWRDVDGAP